MYIWLDQNHKAFIIYIAAFNISFDISDQVHLSRKVQITHLKADKILTEVLNKYADFIDIFLQRLVTKLPKLTSINNHTIKLVDDWQLLYDPIDSLDLEELKTLKDYIQNNLANRFIRLSKPPAKAPIFFDKKSDRSLKLCVNYCDFNNLTIKNKYLLFLIEKSLDWLGWA